MKQALLLFRLLAALTMMVGFAVFQMGGSATAQADRVFVCNLASGIVIEVSVNAVNQGTVGFPFREATTGEIEVGECDTGTEDETTGETTDDATDGDFPPLVGQPVGALPQVSAAIPEPADDGAADDGTTTGGTTGATVTSLPDTGAGESLNQVDYRVAWLAFASVILLALGGYWVRQVALQAKRVDRD